MTEADMYRVFDQGGILSQRLDGYEYREGQLQMAIGVVRAYRNHGIFVVEAGTGIGKSFAYLVPALLHALEHPDERTVVATSTINLQRQLYDKDIPMLFRMLGHSCKVSLAVGRGNYLCLRRFLAKRNDSALLAQDPESDLGRITAWARQSDSGLLSDYPYRMPGELWGDINSDGDLCQGFRCPYFQEECFYQKAKRAMKEASLIVSNHHLLFSDAAYRYENQIGFEDDAVLPSFQALVFDEAHNIEENATSYFTETYDPKDLKRQLSIIQRHNGTQGSLLEQLAAFSPKPELVDRILDDISFLTGAVDTLNEYLVQLFRKTDWQPCLISRNQTDRLKDFSVLARQVYETTGRLAAKINTFLETNKADDTYEGKIRELKVRGGRVQALGQVLAKFCDFPSWGDDIHWFNTEQGRDGTKRMQVLITPLSIAPLLVDAIFKKLDTVVCTSATLELGDGFRYWCGRVGLPYDEERPFDTASYPSPFDYRRRLLLLTPSDAPSFDKQNPEPYVAYVSDTVWNCVLSSGGGALVLFTSYKMLKAVRSRIEPRFQAEGMTLLCQGDSDRFTLLRSFISDTDASLMATSSFWEGVDAPGSTLRMVVIVKLPFQVPSDPVFKARCDAVDQAGGSGFMQLGLPETTMKLKQGFGRLLRTKEDKGVVLILDSRIMHKGYGVGMIRSLPESYHPECDTKSLTEHIENFLYGN